MTLDEAIKHAEEVADLCEDSVSRYDMTDPFESHMACQDGKCAEEHRQLAEWLNELKRLREQTELEKCSDCISRAYIEPIVEELENICINGDEYILSLLSKIKNAPSVEPERKPGHWEWDQRTGEYVCSECGCNPIYERTTPDVSEIDKYRYCRWCGVKMEVDE